MRSTCRFNSTAPGAALESLLYPPQQSARPSAFGPGRSNRRNKPDRQRFIEDQRAQAESRALERFQTREWRAGDIYAPHDLSPAEMKKWKRRTPPGTDAFDALKLNPLDLYKNFSIMSEYMTQMGRIKHRKETGLSGVNQRKIAKAIRRAVGLGLMPSVHRHPEILAAVAKLRMEGSGF
ncbi:mitochondrial 37S ribosomal protein bS18m [Aspergillus lucknowensis]|uniref:Small ribosomal subunit protein bS18m n=1 Tax=Aspergillus lucknowensis TaxID=176173 RepID=A0ABR4LPL7_9EURO